LAAAGRIIRRKLNEATHKLEMVLYHSAKEEHEHTLDLLASCLLRMLELLLLKPNAHRKYLILEYTTE